MADYTRVSQGFAAFVNKDSTILILGSYPSIKSRQEGFYYGNKYNRFWKVLVAIYGGQLPESIAQKKEFLSKNRIALWDVIDACDIKASADASIKNVQVNDIKRLVNKTEIQRIYINGEKAYSLYKKYCTNIKVDAVKLPSTSPANAAYSLDKLIESWQVIRQED